MKLYNEKKFCFIICTNNDIYLKECLLYLSLLSVPDGYKTEVLTIMDAKSMTAGYNAGMNASDARYKIYLHQDTFIVEKLFLHKLLKVFKMDSNIGMVGMIGTPELSKDGVMWHGERCGDFYRMKELLAEETPGLEQIKEGLRDVEAIDGLLMATREDIPWREDILKGWDFYDVSQCMEFRRAGLRIVVPAQNPTWTIHECGIPSYWQYNKNREILLNNYPEIYQKKGKLRILFFHSNMITLLGIPSGLIALGHCVEIAGWKVPLNNYDEDARERMEEFLELGHYDVVITYDFSETVSEACRNLGVKYLAWVYDSPLLEMYTKEAESPENYICVFDRKQYQQLSKRNIKHLYHFPLATEVDCFGRVGISRRDEKKYRTDIAFVGRLYAQRGFERIMEGADKKLIEEAETIVCGTGCRWDKASGVFDIASDELISYLSEKEEEAVFQKYAIDKRYYFESMYLARKANEIERTEILNTLAEHYKVTLYTDKKQLNEGCFKRVRICPWVDYWKEMPKVFHLSRINLNITSRSIESGIPQRVFDVLAVGGFMLTNFQPELEDIFEPGVDLDIYHDMEELLDKVGYYLKHEDIRIRIAMNGYQKVRSFHSYEARMRDVLKKMMEENS